jgi:hypothetical protein
MIDMAETLDLAKLAVINGRSSRSRTCPDAQRPLLTTILPISVVLPRPDTRTSSRALGELPDPTMRTVPF